MTATCSTCRFWLDKPMNPTCRRFPRYEIHGASDWCGEHEPAVASHETVPVPVAAYEEARPETQPACPVKVGEGGEAQRQKSSIKPELTRTSMKRKGNR